MSGSIHPKWKVVLWAADTVEPAILRVPVVILLFLFMWALNLWIMDKLRIPYAKVLLVKSSGVGTLFATTLALATVCTVIMTTFSNSFGYPIASSMTFFYLIVVLLNFLPISTGMDSRISFYRLFRSVLWPSGVITFPEVLLADALTSISKVLKDFGTYFVVAYATYKGKNIIEFHDYAMVLVAILASTPFIIRVRQCQLQLEAQSDWTGKLPVALNILKYLSAFPPIWLTAASSLGYMHPSLPQVITVAATVNSLYSYLWDLVMDWGLFSQLRSSRRQWNMLPWPVYILAAILNLCLRFSWTINRWPGMSHVHSSIIVLIIEIGEVVRRAMWNVIRIEWEVLVQLDRTAEKDTESDKVRSFQS